MIQKLLGKKTHKSIDDGLFLAALENASNRKITLTGFLKEFCTPNEYNEKSVGQKYYKWRADLKKVVDDAASSAEDKQEAQEWLNKMVLADGRAGRVGGRKKVNRLESFAAIKARLLAPKTTSVESKEVGQTAETAKVGQNPEVSFENGDVIIKTDGQKITVHSEAMSHAG